MKKKGTAADTRVPRLSIKRREWESGNLRVDDRRTVPTGEKWGNYYYFIILVFNFIIIIIRFAVVFGLVVR